MTKPGKSDTCNRKVHYPNYAAALTVKRSMKQDDLWIYRCGDHWHLGHPSAGQIAKRLRAHVFPGGNK